MGFFKGLFGDSNTTELNRAAPIVAAAAQFEEQISRLTDAELKEKTNAFKERLSKGEALDSIAGEAFATVREAAKRTLNQRHFDVQIIGGYTLHSGNIAEMRTGEGKTLVATLPAYLNALSGKGVHIVTVNDYLSRRDGVWMGQIYYALGLAVGIINHEVSYLYDPAAAVDDLERDVTGGFRVMHNFLRPVSRREAYRADITYGTNNEFGFDYLRDNIERDPGALRQRTPQEGGHHFAIVDEIDSILIDEARTPLIISAPVSDAERLYDRFATLARTFTPEEDFTIDEKHKQIALTDHGIEKAEKYLGVDNLYTDQGIKLVHHLETAVRAQAIFQKDKDYVVRNGEVVIVDEFTGRLQPGRRWSEGLHQAIEAKEGVAVQQESRTVASITFQNYFRLYEKLAGMTGTAATSSEEFYKVYGLTTVSIPTHKAVARIDRDDLIFQTERGKMTSLAHHVKELHEKGQPVLIGTVSVEKNEILSAHFKQAGIPHQVLNAKNHEQEGEIIAQAGRKGGVTIATNMAGRGVDIKLGGNPATPEQYEEVKRLGGLCVIGTERHEARRIDNQLRGRAGRQGDPGETQFYVSLEDSLMRIFASDMIKRVMGTFGMPEDEAIFNPMITRSLERAQTKIEEFNFDARKQVLAYDDVLNAQRQSVYTKRRSLLTGGTPAVDEELTQLSAGNEEFVRTIMRKHTDLGDNFYPAVRFFLLQTIDYLWMEHLEAMEYLRSSVSLRAIGQRDPLVEYKKEGLRMFQTMQETYANRAVELLPHLNTPQPQSAARSIDVPQRVGGAKPIGAYERNERVMLTNGTETRELKFKKAEELLKQGWRIVE